MSKRSQETQYLASLPSDRFVEGICRNISCALGKWSLHSRWNFISTFTEFHVHGEERWPMEVTSNTYFRWPMEVTPTLISADQRKWRRYVFLRCPVARVRSLHLRFGVSLALLGSIFFSNYVQEFSQHVDKLKYTKMKLWPCDLVKTESHAEHV